MRTEGRADSSISQSKFLYVSSIHPNMWMLENGPYQLPHLLFAPVVNNTIALFEFDYSQDGKFKYGTVTLPEERTDIPENVFTPDRFETPSVRFGIEGEFINWEDLIRSSSSCSILERNPLGPTRVPVGGTYRYRGTSYKVSKIGESDLMNLYVQKFLSKPENPAIREDTRTYRAYDMPVNLVFPLGIEDADLEWLSKNRYRLNDDQFQEEVAKRLHLIPTILAPSQ